MSPQALERDGEQPPLDDAERRRRMRLKAIAAASLVAVVASLGALIWLFGPGGSEPDAPANVTELPYVDGTLVVVEDRRLVMRPFRPLDGRGEVEFTIREADAQHFDIAHLRSHSSVALPTRLYYERSGGRYYARYKEDAPANSQRGS